MEETVDMTAMEEEILQKPGALTHPRYRRYNDVYGKPKLIATCHTDFMPTPKQMQDFSTASGDAPSEEKAGLHLAHGFSAESVHATVTEAEDEYIDMRPIYIKRGYHGIVDDISFTVGGKEWMWIELTGNSPEHAFLGSMDRYDARRSQRVCKSRTTGYGPTERGNIERGQPSDFLADEVDPSEHILKSLSGWVPKEVLTTEPYNEVKARAMRKAGGQLLKNYGLSMVVKQCEWWGGYGTFGASKGTFSDLITEMKSRIQSGQHKQITIRLNKDDWMELDYPVTNKADDLMTQQIGYSKSTFMMGKDGLYNPEANVDVEFDNPQSVLDWLQEYGSLAPSPARGEYTPPATDGQLASSPLLGLGSRGGGKRKRRKSKKSKKRRKSKKSKSKKSKSKRRNKSKKSKRRRTRRHIR